MSKVKETNKIINYLRTVVIDEKICFISKFDDGIRLEFVSFDGVPGKTATLPCTEVYSNGEKLYFIKDGVIYCYTNDEIISLVILPLIYEDYKICLKFDDKFLLACKANDESTLIEISAYTGRFFNHSDLVKVMKEQCNFNPYSEPNRFFVDNGKLYITVLSDTLVYSFVTGNDRYISSTRISEIVVDDMKSESYLSETKVANQQGYIVNLSDNCVSVHDGKGTIRSLSSITHRMSSAPIGGFAVKVYPNQRLEIPLCTKYITVIVISERIINDKLSISDKHSVNVILSRNR